MEQHETIPAEIKKNIDTIVNKYKDSNNVIFNTEMLANALNNNIFSIEKEMQSLKAQITQASVAKDEVSVFEFRSTLRDKYTERELTIAALKKYTGRRYKRTVSAWSRGNRSSLVGVILAAFVSAIVSSILNGIIGGVQGVIIAALCMGGGLALGNKYGHLIPFHLVPVLNVKKTNLFLSIILTLVMGVGFLYSIGLIPFLPDQVFQGHTTLLIIWLVITFSLSFIAVRYRIKTMVIIFSIIVALAYINFVLYLTARIWLIDFIVGLFSAIA